MSASLIGSYCVPVDGATLEDGSEQHIDPRLITLGGSPATAAVGDLVRLICGRRGLDDIVQNKTGGQNWLPYPTRQTGSSTAKVYEATFNGTWDAANLPSFLSVADPNRAIQIYVEVWRDPAGVLVPHPIVGTSSQAYHAVTAPTSPFDCTANSGFTGSTTLNNALLVGAFFSADSNTWSTLTAGYAYMNGQPQYRALGGLSRHLSLSPFSKNLAVAGAIGAIVDRQATNGGDPYMWILNAYVPQSAGVTLSSVSTGAVPLLNGQTGVIFTGTKVGATWTGFKISPTNNAADAGAITQTISGQTGTTITLGALVLGSLADYTSLYGFATDSNGNTNSAGFVIQRGLSMTVTYQVKNLAGAVQNSVTGITYDLKSAELGVAIPGMNGVGATDGSGYMAFGPYAPASAPVLNRGDRVWLTLEKDNAVDALAIGTHVKLPASAVTFV